MFIRGMGRMGDYVTRGWKTESWYTPRPVAADSLIPGVSNTTAMAVAGGGLGLAALAALAWYLTKR